MSNDQVHSTHTGEITGSLLTPEDRATAEAIADRGTKEVEGMRQSEDETMRILLAMAEALAEEGMIDSVGGNEWFTEHSPSLPEGTFRREGAFGRLAEKLTFKKTGP